MEKRLQNRLNMHRIVTGVCDQPDQKQAVESIPAFLREYTAFKTLSQQITATSRLHQQRSAGITKAKANLRLATADSIVRLASALHAYADVENDLELRETGKLTRSDLKYGPALSAVNRAETILAAATKHLAALADYGVDQTQLDNADLAVDAFSAAIGKPREAIIERRSLTQSLPELFAQADIHLARLDDLTEQLEPNFPAFVKDFRNARVIVNQRATHRTADQEEDADANSDSSGGGVLTELPPPGDSSTPEADAA